jgi:nucleotide-binding universal stress UspA family protein
MKTILVLTDFSIRADHAATYATQLAIHIHADILLCAAIETPVSFTDGNGLSWPTPQQIILKKEYDHDLRELGGRLKKLADMDNGPFKPVIKQVSQFGQLADVAGRLIAGHKIHLVVMGSHRSNLLARILMSNHTHSIIDALNCPVLILPEVCKFSKIKSIAYATDLTFSNGKVIRYLADIAKWFDAGISVNHVTSLPATSPQHELAERLFSSERAATTYPHVHYHNIIKDGTKEGLLAMINYIDADILTLVHKQYDFFQGLFHSSISKQLADNALVPVLILPHSFSENVADMNSDQLDTYCFSTTER